MLYVLRFCYAQLKGERYLGIDGNVRPSVRHKPVYHVNAKFVESRDFRRRVAQRV